MKFINNIIDNLYEKNHAHDLDGRIVRIMYDGSYDMAFKAAEEAIRDHNTELVTIYKDKRICALKQLYAREKCSECGKEK